MIAAMKTLAVVDKPADLGLSAERLARIGPFFEERYVRRGALAGVLTAVARRGQLAHLSCSGVREVSTGAPLNPDTIFRAYSMTKPIVSVALMTLYEEGRFQLDDPVSRFIPEFAELRVWDDGTPLAYRTVYPERPMQIRDLLTHTSGLTYGFMARHPVDALYRRRGVEGRTAALAPMEDEPSVDLAEMVAKLAELPLQFSPGTRWNYSVSTDVCGHLVEVISGQPLDRFLAARVFEPLRMVDTGFAVRAEQADRLAACYAVTAADKLAVADPVATSSYRSMPTFLSGGGGLVSTAADYLRFTLMLLNGGELDGARVLGRKTVEFMTLNHLPTGGDLASMGQRVFSETTYEGIGFGLGFSVMLDPARAAVVGSVGEYAWGGAASTMFWVDPREELVGLLLTQLIPSSSYPLRREMKALTYQALID
jgi:CubicO group peptidase (beta-lactamase class C family)